MKTIRQHLSVAGDEITFEAEDDAEDVAWPRLRLVRDMRLRNDGCFATA